MTDDLSMGLELVELEAPLLLNLFERVLKRVKVLATIAIKSSSLFSSQSSVSTLKALHSRSSDRILFRDEVSSLVETSAEDLDVSATVELEDCDLAPL